MIFKKMSFLLIMLIWFISACSLLMPVDLAPQKPANSLVEAEAVLNPAPDVAGGAPQMGGGGVVYPETPELVVTAFLSAYQDNPVDMYGYLSAGRLQAMPAGGMEEFLGITGKLEGFAIQSAAVIPDPPVAQLEVGLVIDGNETKSLIDLVFENGRWLIDAVETVR